MNRAIKNKTRGKQSGTLPKLEAPSPGKLVQNFDGRANTNAGSYERKADGETPPHDRLVSWDTK